MEPTERVKKIASLFKFFKNPDKETVLTPWRVVNMHMSDCLGGWDFFGEGHAEDAVLEEPRFIDCENVTTDVFAKEDTKILEINSKTGLYPLYVAYSVYRYKCEKYGDTELTYEKKKELWNESVQDNVYVVCKTPMAKAITRRTLVGYSDKKINAHYFDDLLNTMQNKPQLFIEKVTKAGYWKEGGNKMKFDGIVGNPPYMKMDDGAQASAKPIYNNFVETSIAINPAYVSFKMPTRWYDGGEGRY